MASAFTSAPVNRARTARPPVIEYKFGLTYNFTNGNRERVGLWWLDRRVTLAAMNNLNALHVSQILVSAFLAICFLQSGLDKIFDRQGNLDWLKGHFAKSLLTGMVPFLVLVITILEITAGALSAIGCILIILSRASTIAFYGAVVAGLAILALFFGQRLAKDYAGAAVLASYFLVALAAIYLLGG